MEAIKGQEFLDKVSEALDKIRNQIRKEGAQKPDQFRGVFYRSALLKILKDRGCLKRHNDTSLTIIEDSTWNYEEVAKALDEYRSRGAQHNASLRAKNDQLKNALAEMQQQLHAELHQIMPQYLVKALESQGYKVRLFEMVRKEVTFDS